MEFPATNESQTAAYFSFHGVHFCQVRRSIGDESGCNITPAQPGKTVGMRRNEERKLAVPCFLSALLSIISCEEATLPDTAYFRLFWARLHGLATDVQGKGLLSFSSACLRSFRSKFFSFLVRHRSFWHQIYIWTQMYGWPWQQSGKGPRIPFLW